MLMKAKKTLRRLGYDVVRYHPQYEALLKRYNISTVIDIGANSGGFAIDIHERLPEAAIYSFEPLKGPYGALAEHFKDVPTFKAYNVALGDSAGQTVMKRSSFTPSSSILEMAPLHKALYPRSSGSEDETVTIERLDDALGGIDLKKNILVKIDVQGFEDKVILGGKNVISQACMLVVEASFAELYKGQPLFGDIHELLHGLGFAYHGSRERHWNNATNEPIYEDSIYLKSAGGA